jgi:hypothetical protein
LLGVGALALLGVLGLAFASPRLQAATLVFTGWAILVQATAGIG